MKQELLKTVCQDFSKPSESGELQISISSETDERLKAGSKPDKQFFSDLFTQ